MDKTETLQELLAKWEDTYESDQTTITLNNTLSNVTLSSPYTVTSAIGAHFPNAIYTTNGTTTAPWFTSNPTGAKIQLDGENADIEVNGWSLVDAVKRIEKRLDLFQPNPELEAEWAELKQLGEQYRKLEQYIRDKQSTFDRLKAMPAPDID
jgi:hypothetical protein